MRDPLPAPIKAPAADALPIWALHAVTPPFKVLRDVPDTLTALALVLAFRDDPRLPPEAVERAQRLARHQWIAGG